MSVETATASTIGAIDEVLPLLAARSERCDEDDRFVAENVNELSARGFLEALVPTELGGGGAGHGLVCGMLRDVARA